MPSPEFGFQPQEPEQRPNTEHEPSPYHRAARFGDEHSAVRAYNRAQRAIRTTPCDVSVYRLLIDQVPHVAAVGDEPPADLDRALGDILAAGDAAHLPDEVLAALIERRRQASRLRPWVERHHRPGRPV